MRASNEITCRICAAVPSATPEQVAAILAAAGEAQIFFAQGQGEAVTNGKSKYPDYLQIQVKDAREAARLAQQLTNACADAISNGGQLRGPVTLLLGGEAQFSE